MPGIVRQKCYPDSWAQNNDSLLGVWMEGGKEITKQSKLLINLYDNILSIQSENMLTKSILISISIWNVLLSAKKTLVLNRNFSKTFRINIYKIFS